MRRGKKRLTSITISDPSEFADPEAEVDETDSGKRRAVTWSPASGNDLVPDTATAGAGSSTSALPQPQPSESSVVAPFGLLFDAIQQQGDAADVRSAQAGSSSGADAAKEEEAGEGSSGQNRPCSACRIAKVRCDREVPCSRCRRLGFLCKPPPIVPRGRPSHHSRLLLLRGHDRKSEVVAEPSEHVAQSSGDQQQAAHAPPLLGAAEGNISSTETVEAALASPAGSSTTPTPPAAGAGTSGGNWPVAVAVDVTDEEEERNKLEALRAQLKDMGVEPCV